MRVGKEKERHIMRELKFRAWDAKEKQMISPDYVSRTGHAFWKENSIPTSSNLVMQFTGLYDNFGNKIYESDIITFPEFYETPEMTNTNWIKGKVVFIHGSFHIQTNEEEITPDTYNLAHEMQSYDGRIEVIGNIYQNPELL